MKYVLLVNRIPAKIGHDVAAALRLTEKLSFTIDLHPKSREFIEHVSAYGEYRYLDVSYFVDGYVLPKLDLAVWELRRYCQVLDVLGKALPAPEQRLLDEAHANLRASSSREPHGFRLHSGFLETVLAKPDHPARRGLVWQNAFFGARRRRKIKAKFHMEGANAPLYLFPEMLDELLKYVFIPKDLREGWRQHLQEISADPSKRP